MKTFRELISWELEQEKQANRPAPATWDEPSARLSHYLSRKLRNLNSARSHSLAQNARAA